MPEKPKTFDATYPEVLPQGCDGNRAKVLGADPLVGIDPIIGQPQRPASQDSRIAATSVEPAVDQPASPH